jgi:hypothetical protein
MTAAAGFFRLESNLMALTPQQHDAMVRLGEPSTPETFVTDAMLQELASLGIVEYDQTTGKLTFTYKGKRAYRDAVGHWPTQNV